jgi:predicted RNA-binding Zn-ribbon protein involved in translation (DUF1610 family)
VALAAAEAPPAAPAAAASASLKCVCRHCNGRISFPSNAVGATIPCPHCGKETVLNAPGVSAAAPRAAGSPPAPPSAAAPARAKVPTPPVPSQEELSEAPARKKGGGGKKVMLIVGILLALGLVAGGVVFFLKNKSGGGMSLLGPKVELEVVSYELQKNQGTSLVYVTGKVRNNTDIQHTSVRVDFKLFDAADKQIGNASDYIMILEPKQEWDFKALVVEPEVAKVEVDKITSSK